MGQAIDFAASSARTLNVVNGAQPPRPGSALSDIFNIRRPAGG
jgi:hypothetical protein